MSDTPDLSAAAAEAAKITPVSPAPEPEPEAVEIDETAESFPREVVEKLRAENAKWRTRTRDIEAAFEGYSPAEKERFLTLAHQLTNDPAAAYDEFAAVTNRLATQLGKENPVEDSTPAPEPAPTSGAPLTAADIERIVADRIEAERRASAQQDSVAATFAEAEALSDDYKTQSGKAFLLAVAQENGTDLAGAHAIIQQTKEAELEAAIASYREGVRTGQHPPRLPAGDSQSPGTTGPPKTLQEARAAMEERFRATYGD